MRNWSNDEILDSDRNLSLRYSRNGKNSELECAKLLYEEIQLLVQDSNIFEGNYNLLIHHFQKLSHDVA